MELQDYLRLMVQRGASDLFLSAGAPPNLRVEGNTGPLEHTPIDAVRTAAIAREVMTDAQAETFARELEMNLAIGYPDIGRFRFNIYRQRGDVAIAVRHVKSQIPSLAELGMPAFLKSLVLEQRGLILISGATGSGKSTTAAAMLDHRNANRTGHILTIEEPIEYLHAHRHSIVDQREIGFDTLNWTNALQNAMREAPDVIMIGEIHERAVMQQAISYAETGHLCISTLHANNTHQALERIVHFFPDEAKDGLFMDLSLCLRAIITQRLVPGLHGKRVPAVEVMLNTPYIADLIRKGEIDRIHDAIAKGRDQGMSTFDQSLFDLYARGAIDREAAVRFADSHTDVSVRIRLAEGRPQTGGSLRIDSSP